MVRYSRETALSWLSSAGMTPDLLHILLESEPDPVRILASLQAGKQESLLFSMPDSILKTLHRNSEEKILEKWNQLIQKYEIKAMTVQDPV